MVGSNQYPTVMKPYIAFKCTLERASCHPQNSLFEFLWEMLETEIICYLTEVLEVG